MTRLAQRSRTTADADRGISLVDARAKASGAVGLEAVVELFEKALADLVVGALRLEAARAERAEHHLERSGVVEVALDGVVDARAPHLHGDLASVPWSVARCT